MFWSLVRLFFAGSFVVVSLFAAACVFSAIYPGGNWPQWSGVFFVVLLFGLTAISMFVFNRLGLRPNLTSKTVEEQIADLDKQGLIQRDVFRARRAFVVEEFEDEGPFYYVELEDGRVLCLYGQYLMDYEPIEDDPEFNQPRTFPCTEFEVLRHRTENFAMRIDCRGEVFEPELTAEPFTRADFKRGVPDDGDIITDRSYDGIKAENARR